MKIVRTAVVTALLISAGLVGCSGGGSAPGPDRTPSSGAGSGGGSTVPLDQTVSFTIVVPAPIAPAAAAHRLKKQSTLGPYVSPNTASVVIQLQTVDGQPLRVAPTPYPAIELPATCASGCRFPVPPLAAAKGVNQFSVQTFAGTNGTGALLSTGSVFVTLPSTSPATIGDTTLALGGFASDIRLTLVPAHPFQNGIAGTGALDYNTLDATGAIIIGATSLLNTNGVTFSLGPVGTTINPITFANAALTTVTTQASGSIPISYTGHVTPQITVTASFTDVNGIAVAKTLPIPVDLGTVSGGGPKPMPTGSPLSLYVYDGMNNVVLEYDGIRTLETGAVPASSPAPRRAFAVVAQGADSCSGPGLINVNGMAVGRNGKIYTTTTCQQPAGSYSNYVYDQNTTQPLSGGPTPIANLQSTLTSFGSANFGNAVAVDASDNVYIYGASQINRFAPGTTTPNGDIGASCLTALQTVVPPVTCDPFGASPTADYAVNGVSFAVDSTTGVIDVPAAYSTTAPEPVASQVPNSTQYVVASYRMDAPNPTAPVAVNALSGYPTSLGATFNTNGAPLVAVDNGQLYAFDVSQTNGVTFDSGGNPLSYTSAGLSDCMGLNDTIAYVAATACSDGDTHAYLMGFSTATLGVLNAANAGTGDVGLSPTFIIGGDGIVGDGEFGVTNVTSAGNNVPGSYPFSNGNSFTVIDGFAFVINTAPGGSTANPPEIDIYDVRTVSGTTLGPDAVPTAKIVLANSSGTGYAMPVEIAVGGTGIATGMGGLHLLGHSVAEIRTRYRSMAAEAHRRYLQRNRFRSSGRPATFSRKLR